MSDVFNVNVNLANGTLAVGTTNIFAFKVPSNAVGGCITVTHVDYVSNIAIAAASAPVFTCVYCGTDSAIDGTVATSTGSVAWTAGTVKMGTLSTTVVDADNYIMFTRAVTTGAENGDFPIINASIQYVMGY